MRNFPDHSGIMTDIFNFSNEYLESVVTEACKDLATARQFVREVGKLAKKYDANYFIVTDGASGISNKGNPAVRNARDAQIKWEKEHNFDPYEDWSLKTKNGKDVTESVKDGGIIEDAQDLYTYLCKNFEYGCPKNGKVYDYEGYEFFQNYKHTSPEQFKKCGGGVCWDYVGFESYWFSKHSGRYTAETYYIEMNNKESATHTFLIYKDKEKDDSHWYYFEVSWQSHRGIYKAKSKEALIQFVVYNMTKRYSGDYEVYKYNHTASLYGKNTIDFMNTIVKTGTEMKVKASKPAGIERIKLGAEIVSEETISDHLDTLIQLLMPGC